MYTLGIDISKDTLDACYYSEQKHHFKKFTNDLNGFNELKSLVDFLSIENIAFESTGNYHKKLQAYLTENNLNVFVLNPTKLSHYRKSQRVHGKTDLTDSFIIAKYLLQDQSGLCYSYPTRETISPYTTTLALLAKQQNQLSNLIHSIELYPETSSVLVELNALLVDLITHKEQIEKDAIDLLYRIAPESKKVKEDIKGVGDKLLLHVIPHIYDHFDKFTLKQINAFFGLNPVQFESGTSIKRKPKMSYAGDALTKKHLYMASISAVRNNEILKEKYLRLKEKGKPSKVALVSIMSHLLRAIVSRLSYHTGRTIKK